VNLLITGRPGCGKTTLVKRLCGKIASKAAGFYTEEIRRGAHRRGFMGNKPELHLPEGKYIS
jgi:nucleoside-triphosphatase